MAPLTFVDKLDSNPLLTASEVNKVKAAVNTLTESTSTLQGSVDDLNAHVHPQFIAGDEYSLTHALGAPLGVNSIVEGEHYVIFDRGTSDFTVCGAITNLEGEVFIANGEAPTGSGTVKLLTAYPLIAPTLTATTDAVYSNSPGAPGDIMWDDTTLYFRNSTKWVVAASLVDSLSDIPLFIEASVDVTGAVLTAIFDQNMATGVSLGTWTLTGSVSGPLVVNNPVCGVSSDCAFDIVGGPILIDEILTLTYTIPEGNDGLKSADDNVPLAGWEIGLPVTNNSEVAA